MKAVFWISLILIIYTYFGYPLLLALFAGLAQKKHYEMKEYPSVSLIIAAYNEEDMIARKIENSLALNYPASKREIIIAADGSTDKTKSIVESYQGRGVILSYRPQRKGKMAALVHAVDSAHGEILVFSDANNLYEEITFKYLMMPFGDETVGGTTGAKNICDENDHLSSSEGFYWKYESWIKKNESRINTCTAAAGEIFAMRRALFSTPPDSIINDDFYLLLRILKRGFKVVYVPEAKSWERISASAKDEIKRRKRINAGRYQALFHAIAWLPWRNMIAIWQILSHKYLRLFVPFLMVSTFVSNTWLALIDYQKFGFSNSWGTGFLSFFFCQLAFYLLALLYPLVSEKIGIKALYLPAFLVNGNFAALQGFFQFVTRRQDATWERVNRRRSE